MLFDRSLMWVGNFKWFFFNNKIRDTIKVYNILKSVYHFTYEPHYNMQFKIILIPIEIKKCYEFLLCP